MTGPQGRSMRPRTAHTPYRRSRFAAPAGKPTRWQIRPAGRGRFVIVDEQGTPVLEHWDAVERLYNRHLAKAAPVMAFALVHALKYLESTANPFSQWVVELIHDALAESLPKPPLAKQAKPAPESVEKTA